MKARIVDIAEVRKSPEEREAEQLLNQLSSGKAIEITLTENETPKKIIRLYRYVSKRMRKTVRIETMDRGAKLLVYLKGDEEDTDDD